MGDLMIGGIILLAVVAGVAWRGRGSSRKRSKRGDGGWADGWLDGGASSDGGGSSCGGGGGD